MNYPKDIKAFYMRLNDDEKTVAAMDVLAPGIGEIIGGAQREERLDVLDRRIAEMNLDQEDYWWYRDLEEVRNGSPCRIRPGTGANAGLRHRHGQCPGSHSLSQNTSKRQLLGSRSAQFDKSAGSIRKSCAFLVR